MLSLNKLVELRIKYLDMIKKKQLKNLSSIAKRIAEFTYDNDYIDRARKYGTDYLESSGNTGWFTSKKWLTPWTGI